MKNSNIAFNPYLPLDVCIADGEPHVFGNRIYIFGSHDRPGGETFCELDYEFWSAPLDDLSNWTSHGVAYSAKQDPMYSERKPYLFAPDVVKGNDGRFYLYYSLAGFRGKHGYEGPISVAVSDTPEGKYEYLGYVKNKDGSPFCSRITFDPGLINDDGVIRMYFGTSYYFDEGKTFINKILYSYIESKIFDRSFKEMYQAKAGLTGAYTVCLDDDMLTVITNPKLIVPAKTNGTEFEGHAFFEAASIRKLKGKYYFIYSSRNNHELCYAVSDKPDDGFVYGGTIISNGDIGYKCRKDKDRLNLTGNNHGSIEKIGEKYYIFYHRMTDRSTYSRQACAEEIRILNDGSIAQVPMTSCGLNNGPLPAQGEYSAAIACVLTNGHMPHLTNGKIKNNLPHISYESGQTLIKEITDGTTIGYRSFLFNESEKICLDIKGNFQGKVEIISELGSKIIETIKLDGSSNYVISEGLGLKGEYPIYLRFTGKGSVELSKISFI